MDSSRLCVDAEGYLNPLTQAPPPVQHPPQSPPLQQPPQSPPLQHPPQSPPLQGGPEVPRAGLPTPYRLPRPCSPRGSDGAGGSGKMDYNGMLYRSVLPIFKRHISVTDLMDCPDISNILTDAEMDRVGSRVRADGNTDAASYLIKVLKTKAGWFDHLLSALDDNHLKLREIKPLFLREKENVDKLWFTKDDSPTEDRTFGSSTSPPGLVGNIGPFNPAQNPNFSFIQTPKPTQRFEIYERNAPFSPYGSNTLVTTTPVEESMGQLPPTPVQIPSQPVSPDQETRSPPCPVDRHESAGVVAMPVSQIRIGSLSLRDEPAVTPSTGAAASPLNATAAPQEHPYDKSVGPDSLLNVCFYPELTTNGSSMTSPQDFKTFIMNPVLHGKKKKKSWFHKDLSRHAAEIRLKDTVPGSFVVRKSPGKYHYSLSLKCSGRVAHFVLQETIGDDGRISYSLGEDTTYRFTCVTSLVKYYTHHPVYVQGESGRGLRLSTPVSNHNTL